MVSEVDGRKEIRPSRVRSGYRLAGKKGDSRNVAITAEHRKLAGKSVEYQEVLASNVRILRTSHGMTQQSLADILGWDRTTIIRIETGATAPSFPQACVLAEVLGVSVDALQKDLSWLYSMQNASHLPEALRKARLAMNLSQDDVAETCGLTRNRYSTIESGRVVPDGNTMAKLTAVFCKANFE